MARVVITGLGCVSALGLGVERFWSGLVTGETGVRPLVWPAGREAVKVAIGAKVWSYEPGDWFPANQIPLLDRFSQFAILAARQAVADGGLGQEAIRSAAVVLGTGCGGKETEEQTYRHLYREGRGRVHPLTIPRGMPSAATESGQHRLGHPWTGLQCDHRLRLFGPCRCAGGLTHPRRLCPGGPGGRYRRSFHLRVAQGMGSLADFVPGPMPPVLRESKWRGSGEGAGVVVLESEAHALARDAKIYAELAGFGLSSDAGHITDPSPNGAVVAMRAALADAGLAPAAIDYVNAHGTGTRANDPCETRAIRQVFGPDADRLVVSSTKAAHGHAMGASGALELIATTLAIRDGVVPPTLNLLDRARGAIWTMSRTRPRLAGSVPPCPTPFAFGGLNGGPRLRRLSSAPGA